MERIPITNKKNRAHTTASAGFTLLEMLVAIFIFSIALVSLATISSRGIVVANNAINQATAQFLAAEGIELVESRRDDNFLTPGADWLDGLVDVCDSPDGCFASAFDTSHTLSNNYQIEFTTCSNGCPQLLRTTSGLYWYNGSSGSPATIFTRKIILESKSANEEIVRSRVEWQRGNVTYAVESQKSIFNWL